MQPTSNRIQPRAIAQPSKPRRTVAAAASPPSPPPLFASVVDGDVRRRRSKTRPFLLIPRASPPEEAEDASLFDDREEEMMLADLERYTKRTSDAAGSSIGRFDSSSTAPTSSSQRRGATGADATGSRPSEPGAGGDNAGGGFKAALDKLLIVDFFFVLFALAWLVAGVATSAGGGTEGAGGSTSVDGPLLSSWFALWPTVFQPAIGILMAGALVSGGVGWLREKRNE